MKQPKFDLDTIPVCQVGMGTDIAYRNGYKHGFQGICTRGLNTLVKGTPEWEAWERGHTDGEKDSEA